MIHADTHRLTRASLELSSRDDRRRRNATFATVVVTLVLATGGALWLSDAGATLFPVGGLALAGENAELRAELERLRTELGLEKATRAELNREAGELHVRINELNTRLEFLTARDGRAATPR